MIILAGFRCSEGTNSQTSLEVSSKANADKMNKARKAASEYMKSNHKSKRNTTILASRADVKHSVYSQAMHTFYFCMLLVGGPAPNPLQCRAGSAVVKSICGIRRPDSYLKKKDAL